MELKFVGRWDGTYEGGFIVKQFSDLHRFWESCDLVELSDENGKLYIDAVHHDGRNHAESRALTRKGNEYLENHRYDSDRKVHTVLKSCNIYSHIPHYAKKVYGCKK